VKSKKLCAFVGFAVPYFLIRWEIGADYSRLRKSFSVKVIKASI
jgi:hypothetical protein